MAELCRHDEDNGAPKALLLGDKVGVVGQGAEENQLVSISAHPKKDLLALGDITGKLTM